MGFRFELDRFNKVLLFRVEGRLTDDLLSECYEAIGTHLIATDARADIFDFTGVTDFSVSTAFVRRLTKREPAMPEADERPRVLVTPQFHIFVLLRMFQLMGEERRPLLHVVRSLDKACKVLGVQSPRYKPLA